MKRWNFEDKNKKTRVWGCSESKGATDCPIGGQKNPSFRARSPRRPGAIVLEGQRYPNRWGKQSVCGRAMHLVGLGPVPAVGF